MATVRKLKSGNYQAILTHKGKRISATGATKDEALQAVFALSANNSKPAPSMSIPTLTPNPNPVNPTMRLTVGEIIDRYINSKSLILSPSTIEAYKVIRHNRFKTLMPMPLYTLTTEVVQAAINSEILEVAPKTVCNSYGLLTSAVGMFAPTITLNATLPRKTKKDIYVPDADEVARIYKMVQEYDGGKLIKPFLLASQCGLRASEIAGLERDCVKKDCVVIKQAMIYTCSQKNIVKSPKSAKGYRTIPISTALSELLLRDCVGKSVCNTDAHYLSVLWIRFRQKYNLPAHLNFHALRHHFASQCLLQGVPQKYIAEMMGHSGTKMIEQVYQHVFPSALSVYGQMLAAKTDTLLGQV